MTNDPKAERIDPETLAAYIDGRLPEKERAEVEARVAADDDSYELLVAVMQAQDALGDSTRAAKPAWQGTRMLWLAGSLAAAAAIVLAVRLAPDASRDQRERERRMTVMVAALNGERYLEPRLTGGFPGGVVRSSTRGPGNLSSQNLALMAVVGELQKRAQAEPSATNLHAYGIGQVLLGSNDESIDSLESAAALEPSNADLLSDLAAAYGVRAAATNSSSDWSNALDRAERALRINGSLLEALFNRALALEALHLDGARAAWRAYIEHDANSEWAKEAFDRLTKLSGKPQGSLRPSTDPAIRTSLETPDRSGDLERAVGQDPQRAREWLEEELSREWAAAVAAHDGPAEARARERGQRLMTAYAAVAQDALPGEAMRNSWSRVTDRAPLAAAMQQYADAAALVREDQLPQSSAILAKALPVLQSAGNPLQYWARYFIVLDWSQQGRLAECLAELDRIQSAIEPRGYSVLVGTVMNRRGQILGRQGNQEGAIRERESAIPYFERAADIDQVAVMHGMLAEAYRFLGDTREAWTHHGESLARLPATPNYRSRHLVLVQAGLTATLEGHYDAANVFQRHVVENGLGWRRASGTSTGYLQLARNSFRLGRLDEADAAIRDARALVADIPEPAFRDRIELELLEVEGEVFGSREPAAGLPVLARATERFSQTGFALRLANLLLWSGRLHARAGDAAAAEADWQRAVDSLEAERSKVSVESLRLAQAGSLRAINTEIALSRVGRGVAASDSLAPLERGRARTLVEDALSVAAPRTSMTDLQHQLDDRTGVIHYAVGDRTAVAWVMTNRGITATTLPVTPSTLANLTDRHRRLSVRLASSPAWLASSRELFRVLIGSLGASLDHLSSIIVVPDPALAGVSFAALNNPGTGAYLIESMSVAMAPSAALLAEPSLRVSAAHVLLVGADRPEGLPPLPWVSNELTRLSQVYGDATTLSGRDATRERFLGAASHASIIHFAGHAFGSPGNPLLSRLVLNRGADGRSDLYAFELSSLDVSSAIVVLAACQTGYAGAGAADDDGVLAMARPFLARGARAVLATYRDVSDRGAPELMAQFHQRLKEGMPPSQAWQATAMAALKAPQATAEWTAYGVFLGRGSLATARAGHVTNDTTSGGRS